MTTADLSILIEQMLSASQHARAYCEGLNKTDFLEDEKTQDAVAMKIIVIGEIATKLIEKHSDFISHNTHVPWRSIKGMRNRIAHGYFEIDQEVVWETVQQLNLLEAGLAQLQF